MRMLRLLAALLDLFHARALGSRARRRRLRPAARRRDSERRPRRRRREDLGAVRAARRGRAGRAGSPDARRARRVRRIHERQALLRKGHGRPRRGEPRQTPEARLLREAAADAEGRRGGFARGTGPKAGGRGLRELRLSQGRTPARQHRLPGVRALHGPVDGRARRRRRRWPSCPTPTPSSSTCAATEAERR